MEVERHGVTGTDAKWSPFVPDNDPFRKGIKENCSPALKNHKLGVSQNKWRGERTNFLELGEFPFLIIGPLR